MLKLKALYSAKFLVKQGFFFPHELQTKKTLIVFLKYQTLVSTHHAINDDLLFSFPSHKTHEIIDFCLMQFKFDLVTQMSN